MAAPLQPSTLAAGHAAADALTRCAAGASPMLQLAIKAGKFPGTSVYQFGSDEVLHAAPLPPKPTRGSLQPEKPKQQPREVPASVVAAAAAVGHAVVTGGDVLQGTAPAPAAGTAPGGPHGPPGGSSVWVSAPDGVTADSRLAARLPEAEFTYIDRPWPHFVTRWAAIDQELQKTFGEESFSMLDLGSCSGFFSLQAAVAYPNASVVGLEGSVGIGNGTIGVDGSQEKIIETKGIQTHLNWIQRLNLSNCLVAPDVWDFDKVLSLASKEAYLCDAMLLLSVVHHMDNVSFEQYASKGLSRVEGSLQLMAKLLSLAPRHFVELPDQPWLQHVYERFGTAQHFLRAAAQLNGKNWRFSGPLVVSEWYGRRELWLMETDREALPMLSPDAIFPTLLPSAGTAAPTQEVPPERPAAHTAPAAAAPAARKWSQEDLGRALLSAPTGLIAAHLALRDSMLSAKAALREVIQGEVASA